MEEEKTEQEMEEMVKKYVQRMADGITERTMDALSIGFSEHIQLWSGMGVILLHSAEAGKCLATVVKEIADKCISGEIAREGGQDPDETLN